MSVQGDDILSAPSPTEEIPECPDIFDEEFQVECIIDKKIENGQVYYKVKWQGFEGQDTWEPEHHISECPELIRDYEKSVRDKLDQEMDEERNSDISSNSVRRMSTEMEDEPSLAAPLAGFERGLEPQRILGATDLDGDLGFLIKWKGSDVTDIIRREEANIKCPQLVIRFYEDRIMWNTQTRSLEEMIDLDSET